MFLIQKKPTKAGFERTKNRSRRFESGKAIDKEKQVLNQ